MTAYSVVEKHETETIVPNNTPNLQVEQPDGGIFDIIAWRVKVDRNGQAKVIPLTFAGEAEPGFLLHDKDTPGVVSCPDGTQHRS